MLTIVLRGVGINGCTISTIVETNGINHASFNDWDLIKINGSDCLIVGAKTGIKVDGIETIELGDTQIDGWDYLSIRKPLG